MKPQFKTILVGNGKSLLDIPRGKLIDAHQMVVRFNCYKLKAEFTGTRTDVWAINRNLLIEGIPNGNDVGQYFAMVHYGERGHPWTNYANRAWLNGWSYLPKETAMAARKFFGRWQPTTGALALGYYGERGGCALIAFDKMSGNIHWFDSVRHKPTIHNSDLEQRWIERHVEKGKAVIL